MSIKDCFNETRVTESQVSIVITFEFELKTRNALLICPWGEFRFNSLFIVKYSPELDLTIK